jgi:hypothetical protein
MLVTSRPPKADVYINGEKVGAADTVPIRFKPGSLVKVEAKGYMPFVKTIQSASDLAQLIELKEQVTEEVIASDPPGATVILDGRNVGTTPHTVKEWKQGAAVTLTLTKGADLAFTRDFQPGETPGGQVFKLVDSATASAVDPNATGLLKVAGAFPVRVRIDGKDRGELGAKGEALPPGTYKVDLQNPKFFFHDSRTVTVKPGQTLTVSTPGLGSILVDTFPGVGQVMVDGAATGVESDGGTPIKLSRGSHTVTVKGVRQAVDVNGEGQKVRFKI